MSNHTTIDDTVILKAIVNRQLDDQIRADAFQQRKSKAEVVRRILASHYEENPIESIEVKLSA